MIDFLFRFSVLNTAFSVIGSEIKEKFGQVGGCWHICLYMWTLYFTLQSLWNDEFDYNLCYISGSVFLFASKYLLFMKNVVQRIRFIRFLDIGVVRKLASFAMNVSIFPVLWFFAIVPTYNGILSTANAISGLGGYTYSAVASVIALLALSGLVCYVMRRKKAPADKTSNTLKRRVRPPSARIAARQGQRAQTPQRPASATPTRRRQI